MAADAKVRALTTRPVMSSDLAFEVPGILEWHNPKIKLGDRVVDQNVFKPDTAWSDLQKRLSDERQTVQYNASAIASAFENQAIFRLRNQHEQVSLTQAISHRDSQFWRLYRSISPLTSAVQTAATDALALANDANSVNATRFKELDTAYGNTPNWGGVKTSTEAVQKSTGTATNEIYVAPVGTMTPSYEVHSTQEGNDGKGVKTRLNDSIAVPAVYSGNWTALESSALMKQSPEFFSQRSVVNDTAVMRQNITEGREFWHPRYDNSFEFKRSQGNVVQEQLRASVAKISSERMVDALQADFQVLEQEVSRHQARLLNTYLVAPFPGLVTAVYKDVGEYVHAGEAVVRIEDDRQLYLHGFIQYQGAPTLGQTVTITAIKLFEVSAQPLKQFSAKVVSIRGHNSDDDEWELMLLLENPSKTLPIGFSFDPQNTKIAFG